MNLLPRQLLLTNAHVVMPSVVWEAGWLLCHREKIVDLAPGDAPHIADAEVVDAGGRTLLPGFIDLHVHGALGYEAMDATPEALQCMAEFYAQHGVTSFLPTTWSASHEDILAALTNIAEMRGALPNGATILGAHLEGPYLNPEKCGAQSLEHIRRAEMREAKQLLALDVIRLLALAPEYEESRWLIEECVRRSITVSAAHTAATYNDMIQAVELGVRQTTHTYNAMRGLHHREPGTLGAALTMPKLKCELIADNIHVHPAAMQILFALKGVDGIILVSDAVRGAGLPEGSQYLLNDRTVVIREGSAYLADGTLAGSTLTMERALRNFMLATGQLLEAVWPASSLNAARAIGVDNRKGSLEIGKDADFVLVDADLNVYLTVAEGRIVYQKDV
ncbi:MAG: N-acetylglucosamine-6-phosphate deacetylase [Phototrophicales bacterium]|nr:MAG: N-acetylglucosamine-6-phosphate deacetylase [Phototrophicales bacterium]